MNMRDDDNETTLSSWNTSYSINRNTGAYKKTKYQKLYYLDGSGDSITYNATEKGSCKLHDPNKKQF
jgi:hypothetical protein